MKIGTKSVLFGAHFPPIHCTLLAVAWIKLYGLKSPIDPHLNRKIAIWEPGLWTCFLLHDLGYIGKPNMDGAEGEQHVEWGASVVSALFDRNKECKRCNGFGNICSGDHESGSHTYKCDACYGTGQSFEWYDFCKYHSRFIASQNNAQPSLLCYADKYAPILEPSWLYCLRTTLTGEIKEYQNSAKSKDMSIADMNKKVWFNNYKVFMRKWINDRNNERPVNDRWKYIAIKES